MKREAIAHTKMKRLCRRMDIPLWQGVGLLETIWQLTAREAPRGDIGKLSDEEIALGIDYRGDESKLIEALVQAGWLDRDPVERLVVHEWHEHCEASVHMRLARARLHFVGGYAPKLGKLPAKEREALSGYYNARSGSESAGPTLCARNEDSCERNVSSGGTPDRSPTPTPSPEPLANLPTPEARLRPAFVRTQPTRAEVDLPLTERFDELWQAWPNKQNRDRAAEYWQVFVTAANEGDVMACAKRYLASDEVSRGEVRELYKFLEQQNWKGWTGDWPSAREPGRTMQTRKDWR